jgi:hypothetical protein
MRIISFPGGEESSPSEETWLAELDAALCDQAEGPAADSWRELRADVRSLASPASPEFMQSLEREFARPPVDPVRPVRRFPWLRARRSPPGVPSAPRVPSAQRGVGRLRVLGRPQLAGVVALIAALLVAVAVVGVGGSGAPGRSASVQPVAAGPSHSAPSVTGAKAAPSKVVPELDRADQLGPSAGPYSSSASAASAASAAGATGAAAAAPGRVQQLAASVSLSASPASVQTVSDGVSQLAVRDEGFVESSHVQVQQHGSSEATLTLRLPSARLSAALAAIGRLAPVSSESQSLQDITNTYDAARRRLADATAERQALLRALAKATTEGQIDSLHERLSQADGAIGQDQSSLNAVSQRASTAEVEVTVLGSAQASSEGLTFHRGLHDAGRVLTVAAIVLLIAAAVLVPLALVIAALAGALRAWRRYSRERALRV